jgi:hypothetical protein
MIGEGSQNHNCRKFYAENVDPARSHLNIEYCNEKLRDVYHELFDKAIERYNAKQTRKDRCINDYYKKIETGKQEKLFHELIIQIGEKNDCACGTPDGELAVEILDEYMQDFQKRNPTLRVFSAHMHLDEATPHLHIDFVPYITESKRGVDTRVSLKQALAKLGFKGGSREETEAKQWVNSEKEQLASVMERHGIGWEQKDTHEEHLSVLDFKKKMRTKEVAELEQEKSALTSENAELADEIAEGRADYKLLKEDIVDAEKSAKQARERAEEAEKQAEICEKNLAVLQPIIDSANKEVKEFKGKVDTQLPSAGMVELATSYRKKILPLFVEMKNKIAGLGASLYKVTQELEQMKQERKALKKENKALKEENNRLYGMCDDLQREKSSLLEVKTMFDRVVRVLGDTEVFGAIQKDKAREQMEAERELQRQKAEPPKEKSVLKKLKWAKGQAEEHNAARVKKKSKNYGMER